MKIVITLNADREAKFNKVLKTLTDTSDVTLAKMCFDQGLERICNAALEEKAKEEENIKNCMGSSLRDCLACDKKFICFPEWKA